MVAVDVEEGVGECAAGEGLGIARVGPYELAYVGEAGGLYLQHLVGTKHELVVVVDGPRAFGVGVGGQHHVDVGHRAHLGRSQATREELVERPPLVVTPVPTLGEAPVGVVFHHIVIAVVPTIFAVEEAAPVAAVLRKPGGKRLHELHSGIEVAATAQLVEGLVYEKPEIAHALVGAAVERAAIVIGRRRRHHIPWQTDNVVVDKVVEFFERLHGVIVAVGIDGGRLGYGFREQRAHLGVGIADVAKHLPRIL